MTICQLHRTPALYKRSLGARFAVIKNRFRMALKLFALKRNRKYAEKRANTTKVTSKVLAEVQRWHRYNYQRRHSITTRSNSTNAHQRSFASLVQATIATTTIANTTTNAQAAFGDCGVNKTITLLQQKLLQGLPDTPDALLAETLE